MARDETKVVYHCLLKFAFVTDLEYNNVLVWIGHFLLFLYLLLEFSALKIHLKYSVTKLLPTIHKRRSSDEFSRQVNQVLRLQYNLYIQNGRTGVLPF